MPASDALHVDTSQGMQLGNCDDLSLALPRGQSTGPLEFEDAGPVDMAELRALEAWAIELQRHKAVPTEQRFKSASLWGAAVLSVLVVSVVCCVAFGLLHVRVG